MAERARVTIGLLAIATGTLAAPLDSAVNIAFPSITRAFGLAVEDIRWVVIAYVLTYSSLMLVFGKLGDLIGYRRIFVAGLAVSAAGFAACSLAPTFGWLLLGRILQGVGIALTLSCGPALATSLADESQRTRMLALYASTTAVGAAAGPLVGGFLVDRFGWSVVFWARIPLVVAGLVLAQALPAGRQNGGMRGFDGAGAALLLSWMASLLLAVAAHSTSLGPGLQLALAAVAAATFVAFVRHEQRHASPIIRPSLFHDGRFLAMSLVSIAMNLAAFSILLLVPFWLSRTAGLDAGTGGIMLSLAAVGTVAGASFAGRVVDRVGAGGLVLAGLALSVVGLGAISLWTRETGFAPMSVAMLVQGLGVGLFQVAYTDLVIATLPSEERGVAGSLSMVTRTIGTVTAATGLAAAHRRFEAAALAAGESAADAFVAGFQTTFRSVAVALAIVAVLAYPVLRGRVAPPT